jgi:TP901 family phage tail tape measure protein
MAPFSLGRYAFEITADASLAMSSIADIRAKISEFTSFVHREFRTGAMELETHMAKLQKVTGASTKELEGLKKELQGLATTMGGVDLDSVFDIANFAARMGLASNELVKFTKDIQMVTVVLGDIPAEEAAKSIMGILNVYDQGADKAKGFASALNALDQDSIASGRDILMVANRISGTGAAAGISTARILALSTALKQALVNNEIGSTALVQVFMKMNVESGKFAQIAKMTKKSFEEMISKDAYTALLKFIEGLKDFSNQDQDKIFDELGLQGRTVGETFRKLSTQIKNMPKWEAMAESEQKSGKSIDTGYAIMSQTAEAQAQRMANAWKVAIQNIGANFLPVFNQLSESGLRLANSINNAINFEKLLAWGELFAYFVKLGTEAFGSISATLAGMGGIATTIASAIDPNGIKKFAAWFAAGIRGIVEQIKTIPLYWEVAFSEMSSYARVFFEMTRQNFDNLIDKAKEVGEWLRWKLVGGGPEPKFTDMTLDSAKIKNAKALTPEEQKKKEAASKAFAKLFEAPNWDEIMKDTKPNKNVGPSGVIGVDLDALGRLNPTLGAINEFMKNPKGKPAPTRAFDDDTSSKSTGAGREFGLVEYYKHLAEGGTKEDKVVGELKGIHEILQPVAKAAEKQLNQPARLPVGVAG